MKLPFHFHFLETGRECYITFPVPPLQSWLRTSFESLANEESHQLLRHSIIPTNVKELRSISSSPYFIFPHALLLRFFQSLVVIKSIATADTPQDDHIGIAWLSDELVVHRFYHTKILLNDAIETPATPSISRLDPAKWSVHHHRYQRKSWCP